jgi:hypothetical protein
MTCCGMSKQCRCVEGIECRVSSVVELHEKRTETALVDLLKRKKLLKQRAVGRALEKTVFLNEAIPLC